MAGFVTVYRVRLSDGTYFTDGGETGRQYDTMVAAISAIEQLHEGSLEAMMVPV